jgi:hypothetical protein
VTSAFPAGVLSGLELEQIQFLRGHVLVQTTEVPRLQTALPAGGKRLGIEPDT